MEKNKKQVTIFEGKKIRRTWDSKKELWYFSIIDVVSVLTDSVNPRDYWFKMKIRVKTEEGAELSTFCLQLKLPASDGKYYLTDVASTEGILRIIQSIPSPKAEPFKLWLVCFRKYPNRFQRKLSESGGIPPKPPFRPPAEATLLELDDFKFFFGGKFFRHKSGKC